MMKRALPWLILLSAWIALATYIWSLFFCVDATSVSDNTVPAAVAAAPVAAITAPGWNYSDGSNYAMTHADYFKFGEAEYAYIEPLTGEFTESIESTSAYLVGHPDRQLNITGYYREGEENTSILPNMGLARANSVKSYMRTLGVPAAQLVTNGLPIEGKWYQDGVLTKGVDFAFSGKSITNDRIPAIKARLSVEPLTLYFQTNQNSLTLTEDQRTDFADMFYYLDNVSDSRLSVTGHTDNVGSRNYNTKLSRDRAEFVKDYLVRKGGVNGAKLNVQGMGPDKPIISNDTPEGRSKNRRVEVTIE